MSEYANLKAECKKKGWRVVEVKPSQLADYSGMNSLAAKKFKFTMPAKTIYIDRELDAKTKERTLRHEMIEAHLMQKGVGYWPAHRIATRKEKG